MASAFEQRNMRGGQLPSFFSPVAGQARTRRMQELDEELRAKIRYAAGPGFAESIEKILGIGPQLLPSADVVDMADYSRDTAAAIKDRDLYGGLLGTGGMLASLGMSALPGTASGVRGATDDLLGGGARAASNIGHNGGPPLDPLSGPAVPPMADLPGAPAPEPARRRVSTETPDIRGMTMAEAAPYIRAQEHLIPKEGGGFVGAPQWVRTEADLDTLRQRIDDTTAAGAPAADWYDSARRAINERTGGDPLDNLWMARLQALYSAQTAPSPETGHVLEDLNSAIANRGVPTQTRTPVQHEKTSRAYASGDPMLIDLGKKTGEYAQKIDPDDAAALDTATGVNDLWHGRMFGYDQESTFGPQVHRFMDYETALAADRANQRGLAGRSDWSGARVQAAPWVQSKAEGLLTVKNKADPDGPRIPNASRYAAARRAVGPNASEEEVAEQAMRTAFDDASRTQENAAPKFTAFATHEAQPFVDAGHLPGLASASPAEKDAFALDPRSRWDFAPGGRDAMYAGLRVPGGPGMQVRPSLQAQGVYTPPGGETEFNLVEVGRPMVGMKEGAVDPSSRALLNSTEALRGLIDAQGASTWHKPIANAPTAELTSFFADTGRALSKEELVRLQEIGAGYGLHAGLDTGRGITLTNFGDQRPNLKPKEADTLLELLKSEGFPVTGSGGRTKIDSGDYMEDLSLEDEWVKPQGSGAATRLTLDRLARNPGVAQALDENPYVSHGALERMERDEAYAGRYGATRADLQNLRRIIGQGPGWRARLQEALRNGAVLPALALPVLGVVPWDDDREQ